MDRIVFLKGESTWRKEHWLKIAWCDKELGYTPEVQASNECQAFKFKSIVDAMAFKLRWI